MPNIATLGDKLSHGGTIITASTKRKVNGKYVARLGDKCHCTIHGPTTIITVSAGMPKTDGKPTAHANAKTACGAQILPSPHRNIQDSK